MVKKVYKVGKEYSIGVFDGKTLLKGASPKYYKTKKGAKKALVRLNK